MTGRHARRTSKTGPRLLRAGLVGGAVATMTTALWPSSPETAVAVPGNFAAPPRFDLTIPRLSTTPPTPTTTPPPVSTAAAPPTTTTTTTAAPRPRVSTTPSPRPKATPPATSRRPAPTPTPRVVIPPRPTAARPAPTPPSSGCPATLAGTAGHVARAGYHLAGRFGVPTSSVLGRGSRGGDSDHPSGYALDFMVAPAVGNPLADYVLAHRAELGVSYVIWRQRYNDGSGWDAMEDRGSATANHMDHVHVSFSRTAPAVLVGC